ncbi:MAG TPA: DUF4185 domain-containing protein [Actinocrinis sp.]|nr:DUF4185 domain-containing protein [Actinocrinis sp.]
MTGWNRRATWVSPRMVVVSAFTGAAAIGVSAAIFASSARPANAAPALPAATLVASTANLISQVSGVPAVSPADLYQNDTPSRFQLDAGDLAIMWDGGDGTVRIAYGDSYGTGWRPSTAGGPDGFDNTHADWRCNTLAFSSDRDLAAGMRIDDMIQDHPGHAAQLLPCQKVRGTEETFVPTSGIHLGSVDYIASMSVNHWDARSGVWRTNYSQISYSLDAGHTWTKSSLRFTNNGSGTDKFQMLTLVAQGMYVYVYGTPNGRFGDAYLARVPADRLLDSTAYEFLTGSGWRQGNQAEADAAPVVQAPVGEISVFYDAALSTWLMTGLDQPKNDIVLRTAPSPAGPWSREQVLVSGQQYPGLYGGFIHPWSNGADLYFTMSRWNQYQVYLMHSTLTKR